MVAVTVALGPPLGGAAESPSAPTPLGIGLIHFGGRHLSVIPAELRGARRRVRRILGFVRLPIEDRHLGRGVFGPSKATHLVSRLGAKVAITDSPPEALPPTA